MKTEIFVERIYNNRPLRISLHILFWLIMLGLQWYLHGISFSSNRAFPRTIQFQQLVTNILNFVIFYYPFVYYVLPGLFLKRRIIMGMIATIMLVIIYGLLDAIIEGLTLKSCMPCMQLLETSNPSYYNYLHYDISQRFFGKLASLGIFIGLLFSIAIPLAIKLGISAFRQQLKTISLAKENITLEFDFLKSQVNPHFLFNTLNNIYGLILNGEKEKSASTIARLSQFLRYTLYESNTSLAPAEKELQLLKDYISMESIRLNLTKACINFTDDGSIAALPPLLFLPVIENAFKYSEDTDGKEINIEMTIANRQIYFIIKNEIDIHRTVSTSGGIGLQNFRKRLELYYPGRFEYKIQNFNKTYIAIINIEA